MNWKATRSSVVFLGLLVSWTLPSSAEVQNVKIGGDVTVRSFYRSNLDLRNEGADPARPVNALDQDRFLMSTMGLNIGADLTENVSTFIRLANERDWDQTAGEPSEIALSQAYITLKELFYSPLTLKLGAQPIVWGRGFVLGSGLQPNVVGQGDDRNAAITANEFTDFTAFDAIRATLDLSNIGGMTLPLTADYVYIKIDENVVGAGDDVNIQGINFSTRFDQANAEVEAYYLNKRDLSSGTLTKGNDGVNTLGFRGSAQPIAGTNVYAELAYQFGDTVTDASGVVPAGESAHGWGVNLGADYTFSDVALTPTLGLEWRFYSGKQSGTAGTVAASGWTPIAPGYFRTALREFQSESNVAGFYPVEQAGVTSGQTNQHEMALYGDFKPIEDLTVAQRLAWFIMDEGALLQAGNGSEGGNRHRFLGTEWDTNLTYAYTDDVQFGVIYALFAPGSVFREARGQATAQELVTTVSVKF